MTVLMKDPDALLDYAVDWSDYLEDGEVLGDSEWSVTPDGDMIVESDSRGDQIATVQLRAGVVGHVYLVTNRIITSLGRMDDRSLTIRVQER